MSKLKKFKDITTRCHGSCLKLYEVMPRRLLQSIRNTKVVILKMSFQKKRIEESSLYSLTHAITSFRESISRILELSPDAEELTDIIKNTENNTVSRNLLMNNPQIKLAVALKELYNAGKLSLFDDVRSFNPALTDSISIGDMNVGTDKTVVYSRPDDDTKDVMRFLADNEGLYPPPLPKIKKQSLLTRVYTHRSMSDPQLSKIERLALSNERLEFLGDSYLNTLVTDIIFQWFPMMDEGELSVLRSSLVCNTQLVAWSKTYQLGNKLQIAETIKRTESNVFNKRYADVFEAYVGALVLESNDKTYAHIKHWLMLLSMPTIKKYIEKSPFINSYLHSQSGKSLSSLTDMLKLNYAEDLYSLIGYAKNPPKYSFSATDLSFTATVSMNNDVLGSGTGKNKKEARNRAARDALENHRDLVNKYYLIRKSIPKESSVETGKKVSLEEPQKKPLQEEPQKKPLQEEPQKRPLQGKPQQGQKRAKLDIDIKIVAPVPNSKLDASAKDKLDSLFFKNKIPLPSFRTVSEGPGRVKITFAVKGQDIAYCLAENESQGKTSLAMWVLKQKQLVKKLLEGFSKKSKGAV